VAVLSDQSEGRRTIRKLIRRGADVDAVREDGTSPVHVAAGFGSEASLRALLERGADPRVRSHRGDTPLHLAAAPQPDRRPDDCRLFIRELVARGADPNALNGFEIAPLHPAALVGHIPLVQGLLDAGAQADLEGPNGATALSIAAVSGDAPIVALLLARGADPGHRDRDGLTALEAALAHPAMRYSDGASETVNVEAVVELLRPRDRPALIR
jgi:ankyrin repeat protein